MLEVGSIASGGSCLPATRTGGTMSADRTERDALFGRLEWTRRFGSTVPYRRESARRGRGFMMIRASEVGQRSRTETRENRMVTQGIGRRYTSCITQTWLATVDTVGYLRRGPQWLGLYSAVPIEPQRRRSSALSDGDRDVYHVDIV